MQGSEEPPPAMEPSADAHFKRPGWFTKHVFNRIVAGLTRLGISVWGSRVLEVRGRRSGEWRSTPVNLLTSRASATWWRRAGRPSGCATCAPAARGGCG